jgi:hypothetical protein
MRDNAISYLHPRLFLQALQRVKGHLPALRTSNKVLGCLLKDMSKRLSLRVIVTDNFFAVSKLLKEVGPDTVLVASKPFKGVGGLLNKSLKRSEPIEKIHDWAGMKVITQDSETMYRVAEFLYQDAIKKAVRMLGVHDFHINEPDDFAANPKPITGYQAIQIDTVTALVSLMMPMEVILSTVEMHIKADLGTACHDKYKKTPLVNGEKATFRQRLGQLGVQF